MDQITQESLNRIYPTPVIRGTRITRMEERRLGQFRLTAEMAEMTLESDDGAPMPDKWSTRYTAAGLKCPFGKAVAR